jgi:hypothetical protein
VVEWLVDVDDVRFRVDVEVDLLWLVFFLVALVAFEALLVGVAVCFFLWLFVCLIGLIGVPIFTNRFSLEYSSITFPNDSFGGLQSDGVLNVVESTLVFSIALVYAPWYRAVLDKRDITIISAVLSVPL